MDVLSLEHVQELDLLQEPSKAIEDTMPEPNIPNASFDNVNLLEILQVNQHSTDHGRAHKNVVRTNREQHLLQFMCTHGMLCIWTSQCNIPGIARPCVRYYVKTGPPRRCESYAICTRSHTRDWKRFKNCQ